ncbi:MAG: hypothetical protein PHU42_01990 [Patescibacteria group bacterium]|nr:hypothetical protein [Patescibacteria group bacterium]
MGTYIIGKNLHVEVGIHEKKRSFYLFLVPHNKEGQEKVRYILTAPSFKEEVARAGRWIKITTTINSYCRMKSNRVKIRVQLKNDKFRESILKELLKTITTWLDFWDEKIELEEAS